MLYKILHYLKTDIWMIDLKKTPKFWGFWIRLLRVFWITIEGMGKSQVQLGASALTYYTLFAIVPLMALLLGLARAFVIEKDLLDWILAHFEDQKVVVEKVIDFAERALTHTSSGLLVSVGILLFLWAAIRILKNIEVVLNNIWAVKANRSLIHQFKRYLPLILILPFGILASTGVASFFSAWVDRWREEPGFFQAIAPVLTPLFRLIPYFVTILLFMFIYIFIPNTIVYPLPAFFAALVAGSIYQLVQWAYVSFQIGVSKYSALYGTFAALPLFLIWLYFGWLILLLGGKFSFAFQNIEGYFYLSDERLSNRFQRLLLLRIAHACVIRFAKGKAPPSSLELSQELEIPQPVTLKLIQQLVDVEVISSVVPPGRKELRYQPAIALDQLTIKRVLDKLDGRGESLAMPDRPEIKKLQKSLTTFESLIEKSNANLPLREI